MDNLLDPAYLPAYTLTFLAIYMAYQLNAQGRLARESQTEKGEGYDN